MWQVFRTLRFKLVMLYLVVFGVIQVSLSLVVLNRRSVALHADFDARLRDRGLGIINSMDLQAEPLRLPAIVYVAGPGSEPLHFVDCYYQIRDSDGKLIEASENLRTMALPWTSEASQSNKGRRRIFETLDDDLTHRLLGVDNALRMVTIYHERPAGGSFHLQIARSLGPIDKLIDDLAYILITLAPVGLLAAGGASWLMARRSLAPIGRIAREARELTAARLDRRIPLPSGRDEVADMVETINGMLDRLEAAFQAQQRFIANAAHELKTPLSVLLGEAQVMTQRQRTPEEYGRFIGSVEGEVRRLAQLVDSLLTLARADAGLPLPVMTPVSINEIVTNAVQRCSTLAHQGGVRLVPVLALPISDDEDEPMVAGDADLMSLMVLNLLRNAVRFSPRDKAVEIQVSAENGHGQIAVRDLGPGIPEAHLPHLFERFFQVPGRDERPIGTGLGLAIARGVARMHGGDIRVANRLAGGCEFVIDLPVTKHPGRSRF